MIAFLGARACVTIYRPFCRCASTSSLIRRRSRTRMVPLDARGGKTDGKTILGGIAPIQNLWEPENGSKIGIFAFGAQQFFPGRRSQKATYTTACANQFCVQRYHPELFGRCRTGFSRSSNGRGVGPEMVQKRIRSHLAGQRLVL